MCFALFSSTEYSNQCDLQRFIAAACACLLARLLPDCLPTSAELVSCRRWVSQSPQKFSLLYPPRQTPDLSQCQAAAAVQQQNIGRCCCYHLPHRFLFLFRSRSSSSGSKAHIGYHICFSARTIATHLREFSSFFVPLLPAHQNSIASVHTWP